MPSRLCSCAVAAAVTLAIPARGRAQQSPRVVVTTAEVRLEVPAPTGSFGWNLPSTEPMGAEYVWAAEWSVGDTTYAFGFYRFRRTNAPPREGNIRSLLAVGQASVWVGVDGPSIAIPRVPVRTELRSGKLIIRVLDQEVVQRFFQGRPLTVEVLRRTPDVGETRMSVAVEYASG